MIGAPVSFTGMPRTRPSVMSMAMQRTTLSPRCWATSTMRLSSWSSMAGFVMVRAFRMVGSLPFFELHVDNRPDDLYNRSDIHNSLL